MTAFILTIRAVLLAYPALFSAYSLLINFIAFILYGIDKRKAQKGCWRISEATLLLFAVLGGALGSLLGMNIFHHKTKHLKFCILVPLFFLLYTFFFLLLWM